MPNLEELSSILGCSIGIRRNFLWEGNNNSYKFHLVKWDKVIKPKAKGGLGIIDLGMHNKCLLMKWLWRYATTDSSPWKEVIKAKHGVMDNWSFKIANAPYGVGPWKYISKLGQLRMFTLKLAMVNTLDFGKTNG